jgi:hypothetical protein
MIVLLALASYEAEPPRCMPVEAEPPRCMPVGAFGPQILSPPARHQLVEAACSRALAGRRLPIRV